ncbi:MAG: diguanylate cyclase, partial [Candidatus Limnocylindria bacterium]
RLPGRAWLEAGIALALVTVVVLLTGRAASPFVVGYAIVAVGVALARGARAAVVFAAIATGAYLVALGGPPSITAGNGGELLRIGANILGIWLVTGLAGAYAAQERRARTAYMELSLTDPLTGLFNRSQIFSTLDQEIRRTRRSERGFCVLMIDLDGLKTVNDSFGHHRGDELLRHLGIVIRRSIRTVDTAYRYGGDEFLVLLPETDIVGAFVVAEKIRAGAEELGISLGLDEVDISVSIGLISHPEDGLTVEELMIAADRAMYQAKALGKNQISGYPRPRRLPSLPAPAETPRPATSQAAAQPVAEPEQSPVPEADNERQQLRPVEMAAASTPSDGSAETAAGEEEPDPTEVRRQIAAASRSFDPDHQIRRAMDAFLGPMPRDGREH